MKLIERDEQIISVLTRKVRLLSLDQLARGWWDSTSTGRSNTRRRIAELRQAGWLVAIKLPVKKLATLDSPLIRWSPGCPGPDLGNAAWILKTRWQLQMRTTTLFLASRFAAQQFGGKGNGKPKKNLQVSHDLGVSEIFVNFLTSDPESAHDWLGEDLFRESRRGSILPDALLIDDNRTPYLAIEFGGAYDKLRLESWHHDCASRQLPYEIW
jgi:hypothetical protein